MNAKDFECSLQRLKQSPPHYATSDILPPPPQLAKAITAATNNKCTLPKITIRSTVAMLKAPCHFDFTSVPTFASALDIQSWGFSQSTQIRLGTVIGEWMRLTDRRKNIMLMRPVTNTPVMYCSSFCVMLVPGVLCWGVVAFLVPTED